VTIRAKVIFAFAAVLCCATGLGLFAVQRLDTVNDASAVVSNTHLVRTRLLGQLSYQTMRYRQLEATAALAPDAAARAREATTMEQVRARGEQVRREYEVLVGDGGERRQADEAALLWQNCLGMHDRFETLLEGAHVAAVAARYRGEMLTEFNKFQTELSALVTLNDNEAK